MVFNATFSNISAISWRPVLVMEVAGVPGANHRAWKSNLYPEYVCGIFIFKSIMLNVTL